MNRCPSRREVVAGAAGAALGYWISTPTVRAENRSPHAKLNVACVGIGGRGNGNVDSVIKENILGLCEVDAVRAGTSFSNCPMRRKFTDWRRMLDKLHKELDAVVISTPDHMHAPITLAAIQLGKHVYCESRWPIPSANADASPRRLQSTRSSRRRETMATQPQVPGERSNCSDQAR